MRSFLVITSVVFGFSMLAQAQQWGTGMYPAMQGCPYAQSNVATAGGARGTSSAATELDKIQKESDDLDDKIEKAQDDMADASEDFISMLNSDSKHDVASVVSDYLNNTNESCDSFKNTKWHCDDVAATPATPPADPAQPAKDGSATPPTPNLPSNKCTTDFVAQHWGDICSGKNLSSNVCAVNNGDGPDARLHAATSTGLVIKTEHPWDEGSTSHCNVLLKKVQKLKADQAKYAEQQKKLEKKADKAEEKAEKEAERAERRGNKGTTEGCSVCNAPQQSQSPKWWQWLIAGGIDAGNIVGNVLVQDHIANNAAKEGWVYQSPSATNFGYPYALEGLYGSTIAGQGGGGFGCGSSMNSAMMNPYGMQNPYMQAGMNPYMMSPYSQSAGVNPYGMMSPYGTGAGFGAGIGSTPFGYPQQGYGMNPYMGGGGAYMGGGSPWGQYGPNGLGGQTPYGIGVGFGAGYGSPYGQGGYGSPYGQGGYGSNPYSMYADQSSRNYYNSIESSATINSLQTEQGLLNNKIGQAYNGLYNSGNSSIFNGAGYGYGAGYANSFGGVYGGGYGLNAVGSLGYNNIYGNNLLGGSYNSLGSGSLLNSGTTLPTGR